MGIVQIPTPASGKNYNIVKFDATTSWTVPSTTTGFIDILLVGGGGGGGRIDNGNQGAAGGGGAPGCVTYIPNLSVTSGASITVTIGSGGSGATVPSQQGSNGSSSTITGFNSLSTGWSAITTTVTSEGGRGGGKETNNATQSQVLSSENFLYDISKTTSGTPRATLSMDFTGAWAYRQPSGCFNNGSSNINSNGTSGNQLFQNPAWFFGESYSRIFSTIPLLTASTVAAAQGNSGSNATGTGGSSTANTGFAGQGGNGGHSGSSGNGGNGVGGGGGGGAGRITSGTCGSGGNASANSGSGGGGGGGGNAAGITSGNGGSGGSGFVAIGYWA